MDDRMAENYGKWNTDRNQTFPNDLCYKFHIPPDVVDQRLTRFITTLLIVHRFPLTPKQLLLCIHAALAAMVYPKEFETS